MCAFVKNATFDKKIKVMSSEHNEHKSGNDTFFEDSTIAIGFLYTIIALGIIVTIYAFG